MHYRLLGPLQVSHGERPVDIGPPKQRAVLAVLLLAQGRVVSADRLVDAVWGDEVPAAPSPACRPIFLTCARLYGRIPAADDVDLIAFTDHCVAARAPIAEQRWRDGLAAAARH